MTYDLERAGSATYAVGEAGPTVTITATRSGGSSGAVGVKCATANATATAGSDYTAASVLLAWADGVMGDQRVDVLITDDDRDELDETFSVSLSLPTGGAALASPSSGTVKITDNDESPEVRFSLPHSFGAESTTPAVIGVELSVASGRPVSVKYATVNGMASAGSDYTPRAGTLTFPPGVTTRTISVPIINNALVEVDEDFSVALSVPVNATLNALALPHTYWIKDEDLDGAIKLSPAAYSVSEAGATVTITATRVGGSTNAMEVSFATASGTATAGLDYTASVETVTFGPGVRSRTFTVPVAAVVLDDTLDEPNETFTVTLSSGGGGGWALLGSPVSATVTIVDNDPAPKVHCNLPASEGLESAPPPTTIEVTLSAASGKTVTVKYATANGTARAGSDYTATTGTLTFPPGVTSRLITVPITDDAVLEPDETITLTLSAPVNAALDAHYRHLYTIRNDD